MDFIWGNAKTRKTIQKKDILKQIKDDPTPIGRNRELLRPLPKGLYEVSKIISYCQTKMGALPKTRKVLLWLLALNEDESQTVPGLRKSTSYLGFFIKNGR